MQLGYAPIVAASGIITTLIGPILFERSGDASINAKKTGVHSSVWSATLITVLISLAAGLFGFIFHEKIFNTFVDIKYFEASYLLPWIILAGGITSASQVLGLKIMSDLNTKVFVLPKIITSLVGAMMSFIGSSLFPVERGGLTGGG